MSRVFEVIEVKERIQKNVKQFKLLLDKYIKLKNELSLLELTSALIDDLGILKVYKEENTQESMQRYENIQELLSGIAEFVKGKPDATIDDFLAEVSLIAGIDQYSEENNSVTLMTIHRRPGRGRLRRRRPDRRRDRRHDRRHDRRRDRRADAQHAGADR